METYKTLVNNLKEDTEHTNHEDELARDSNLDKIYKCRHTKSKHLQPT